MTKDRLKEIIEILVDELSDCYDHIGDVLDLVDTLQEQGLTDDELREIGFDGLLDEEEFEVQFSNDDDEFFDGGYYNSLEEAEEAALDGYHSDPDYTHFVVYDAIGNVVFCDDDIVEDE